MGRNTSQKAAIKRVLEEDDRPLTPQEILEAGQKYVPGLGIATVYRCVKAFVEEGLIQAVALPDSVPRYELAGKGHHHHFHCRGCGRVFEIDACPGDMKRLTPRGFVLEDHEIVLYGRCGECAGARGARGTPQL